MNETGQVELMIPESAYEAGEDAVTGYTADRYECMRPEPSGIDWVIVGGESGSGARPMHLDWAQSLVRQCQAANVSVFVKQLGAVAAGGGKGGDMNAWPDDLRVREFPAVAS